MPSRVFLPHQGWSSFDAGVAAVGLVFLGIALWGAAILGQIAQDAADFNRVCGYGECTHRGTVTSHTTAYTAAGTRIAAGRPGYCILSMALDVGTVQAAIQGSYCYQIADGSAVDADIWRGQVVVVTVHGQRVGTPLNPEAGSLAGVLRLIALVPFLLCVAIIHFDMPNHPAVRRALRRS